MSINKELNNLRNRIKQYELKPDHSDSYLIWMQNLEQAITATLEEIEMDQDEIRFMYQVQIQDLHKQIEDLKRTDEAMYQIYALGEKAISKSNIYSNWTFIAHRPTKFVKYVYGLDFGYNHPTALVRVYYCDNDIFIEKIIYESYLTTTQLIEKMDALNVDTLLEC